MFSGWILTAFAAGETAEGQKLLSLKECIRIALRNSFEVKKAKLDLYISETNLMYSEAVFDTILYSGASYSEDKRQQLSVFASDDNQTSEYYTGLTKTLPTGTELNTELSSNRVWNNTAFVSRNPSYESELSFNITQPLAKNGLGYIDRSNISLTKLAVKNAGLSEKDSIEEFIVQTEKAYINLVLARKSFEIYEDMLDRAKKLYETDKKNYEVGITEKVDILASEANLSRVKAEYNIAENHYRKTGADLKLLMNVEDDTEIGVAGDPDIKDSYKDLEVCLKDAFRKRRDYLRDKRDVEIKGLDLKIKKNSTWPEIDLNLSMSMNGLEGDFKKSAGKAVVNDNTYYFAGIEFEVSIENRRARSEKKKSEFEKEKALVILKETERTIITEVGNAFNDVEAFKISLAYLKKAVELESEKLNEEEKRFNYGRSNTKRVIDYQRDLLKTELEYVKIVQKHDEAIVDLKRAINVTLAGYEDVL